MDIKEKENRPLILLDEEMEINTYTMPMFYSSGPDHNEYVYAFFKGPLSKYGVVGVEAIIWEKEKFLLFKFGFVGTQSILFCCFHIKRDQGRFEFRKYLEDWVSSSLFCDR